MRGVGLERFALTTYHATDLFVEWGMDEKSEFDLLGRVDQTFASSAALYERCSPRTSHCDLLPNGVDYGLFSTPTPLPADLEAIPRPRLVYAGVVKTQLDLDLMADVAERLPQCSVVLVGPITPDAENLRSFGRLRQLPNVHLLGSKSITELPGYLQHGDVGLMPYQVSNYTNHISPMKLNEYLAAGIPCVCSPIEPLLPYNRLVDLVSGVEEWVGAIQKHLDGPRSDSSEIESRRSVARPFDWDELARKYLTILSRRLEE
jgi:glycosyltransferase involved in cell wall biosynthesis